MKKHFAIYMDDGKNVFKIDVPAHTQKEAIDFVKGNGEIIRIKSGTRNSEDPISMECIANALAKAYFGQMEIDLITRALRDCEFIQ